MTAQALCPSHGLNRRVGCCLEAEWTLIPEWPGLLSGTTGCSVACGGELRSQEIGHRIIFLFPDGREFLAGRSDGDFAYERLEGSEPATKTMEGLVHFIATGPDVPPDRAPLLPARQTASELSPTPDIPSASIAATKDYIEVNKARSREIDAKIEELKSQEAVRAPSSSTIREYADRIALERIEVILPPRGEDRYPSLRNIKPVSRPEEARLDCPVVEIGNYGLLLEEYDGFTPYLVDRSQDDSGAPCTRSWYLPTYSMEFTSGGTRVYFWDGNKGTFHGSASRSSAPAHGSA